MKLLRKDERINNSSLFTITPDLYSGAPAALVQEIHPTPAPRAPHPRTTCTPPPHHVHPNHNRTVKEPPKNHKAAFSVADMLGSLPELNENIADDFVQHRKSKKAPLTKAAWDAIVKEIKKSGWTPDEALSETMARGWQAFKSEWVPSKNNNGGFVC